MAIMILQEVPKNNILSVSDENEVPEVERREWQEFLKTYLPPAWPSFLETFT